MTQLHHPLRARHTPQRIAAQIGQPHPVGQPIHHQRFGHPRHDRLPTMRQIADTRGAVDRRTRVVALIAQLNLAGMHADAYPDRSERRPLQRQRARHRIRGPRERGHEAVALALLDRTHPVISGDGLVHRPVQQRQRGGHLLGLGLPQPRRALDIGQQQRHRPGRQQLAHTQFTPGQRRHLRVLAHGSQHRCHNPCKTSARPRKSPRRARAIARSNRGNYALRRIFPGVNRRIVDAMTIQTALDCPIVTEAGLPTIDYHQLTDPAEAHRVLADARAQTPIAIGPYGPEVLTHDLVRSVLRDNRFITAQGLGLSVQGVTSGPLWDRATTNILGLDGAVHHRLRRLVSKAFAPRAAERLRSFAAEIISGLVEPFTSVGHCDIVTDIARGYPTPVICALLGAPAEDWQLFSDWVDDIKKLFELNVVNDAPKILAAWNELDAYLEELIARRRASPERRSDLRSDPRRRGRRPAHPRRTADALRHPARRRHRHHPQPARRGGANPGRPPRPVGPGRPPPRTGIRRGSRADALQPNHFRHHQASRRGC